MPGWIGSEDIATALGRRPCGCEAAHRASLEADPVAEEVLESTARDMRKTWRCPMFSGRDPRPGDGARLDDLCQKAIKNVGRMVGARLRCETCPLWYAGLPWVQRAVTRGRRAKTLHQALRLDEPNALHEAVDAVERGIRAREWAEHERRMAEYERQKQEGERGR